MTFSWFAFFRDRTNPARPLAQADLARVQATLPTVRGLHRGLVFTPAPPGTRHAFPDDESAPMLALQLDFLRIEALEAAVAASGPLRPLLDIAALHGTQATQQAMLVRHFPVPDARIQPPPDGLPCSYLVHYPGAAEDLNAWLTHYIQHHPPLMARFPNVRGIEIFTRIDWCGGLPWPREDAMQRNKLVFDSAAALSASLLSPALADMRQDFHQFPPFTGGNCHYPMLTWSCTPVGD